MLSYIHIIFSNSCYRVGIQLRKTVIYYRYVMHAVVIDYNKRFMYSNIHLSKTS